MGQLGRMAARVALGVLTVVGGGCLLATTAAPGGADGGTVSVRTT